MELELSLDTSTSNVATLNPYTFPDMNQSKKDPSGISLKGKSGSIRKGNMIQIYRGQYDIVSYNKFLVLRFDDLTRLSIPLKLIRKLSTFAATILKYALKEMEAL